MGQVTRPSVYTCIVVAIIFMIISKMFRYKELFQYKEKRRFRSLLHYFLCACVYVVYVRACVFVHVCVYVCVHKVDREVVQCLSLLNRLPLHCHRLKYSDEMYTERFLVVADEPAILFPKFNKEY